MTETPVPIGTDTLANTFTTDQQHFSAGAALSDGGFVIAWNSTNQEGSSGGVYAQRFNSDGTKNGTEFLVNTFTTGNQTAPAAIGLPGGGFVIVWDSAGQDGSQNGVYGQRYTASGVADGTEFRVNTTTSQIQREPAIDVFDDGSFVVVWSSYFQDLSEFGVYGQRYNANGTTNGAEFRVNTTTQNYQQYPQVAVLADGGFVVTWDSVAQDGDSSGIIGQRYNANGTTAGGEFQVNGTTTGAQSVSSVVGLTGGGFVVTWQGPDSSGNGVFGRIYDASGTATGGEFAINSETENEQFFPHVTALADGGFVVMWSLGGATIVGLRYNADGTVAGDEFVFDTNGTPVTTYGYYGGRSLVTLADGRILGIWDNGFGAGSNVYFRIAEIPGGGPINGTSDNDTLDGTEGDDVINGLAGDDLITGGAGADTIDGGSNGAGGDTSSYAGSSARVVVDLSGAGSADEGDATGDVLIDIENLTGSDHNDRFTGDNGANVLDGGNGNDNMNAGGGADTVHGGEGGDLISGGNDNDLLNGNNGDDTIFGNSGNDTINGGTGTDTIFGGADSDTINGQGDADEISGQGGNDSMDGGGGMDILRGGSGNDTLNGGADNDMLFGNGNNDVINGDGGNDLIQGAAGIDMLFGGSGDDTITGGTGGDRLDGGTGNDTMNGGDDGNRDVFFFGVGYDQDRINGYEQGTDRIELDDALWLATEGVLTGQQVIDTFGSLNTPGTILTLDFGNGDILEVQAAVGINDATLGSDIVIV